MVVNVQQRACLHAFLPAVSFQSYGLADGAYVKPLPHCCLAQRQLACLPCVPLPFGHPTQTLKPRDQL